MKIVKNSCFGGFGLSVEAQKRYFAKKGKGAFFYKQTKYKHQDGEEEYTRQDNPSDDDMLLFVFTEDKGALLKKFPEEDPSYFYDRDVERTDPDLVAVVEEMGAGHGTGASGRFASLEVVDIPDGIEYEIDDYDGIETIREKHRTW